MREDDIITEFRRLKWVRAVFMDGRLDDAPHKGNRNLSSTPYIEVYCEHNYVDSDTDCRIRRVNLTGRIIYQRYQTTVWAMKNGLEQYLLTAAENELRWTIGRSSKFSARCDQLPFTIEFWESAAKTA